MKYICANCEAETLRWEGKCSSCGEWGTLEEVDEPVGRSGVNSSGSSGVAKTYSLAEGMEVDRVERLGSGFSELDRVLGGGIVAGSVILLSGDPGIGKSTLLLQVSMNLAKSGDVLYIAGEESVSQLSSRGVRLLGGVKGAGFENFHVVPDVSVEKVAALIAEKMPKLVIVDSIQSMVSEKSRGYAGSISQVRITGQILTRVAKDTGVPIIIVGQINKDGAIAGPKVLEHTVDTVLYLEGDEYNSFRILRSIKNRFGPTHEIGVFEMREKGFVEISNPSEIFIQESDSVAGSCVSAIVSGSRVVFLEVQALVVDREGEGGPLRRVANGFKKPRLDMLCAVLSKRGKVSLAGKDVFVNIVGGLAVTSPSIDLAVCKAIKSAFTDKPVSKDGVYVGEVGLTGGVRAFFGMEMIVNEAMRLGYKSLIVPDVGLSISKKVSIIPIRNVAKL